MNHIVTDILDPTKGSEWQASTKFIEFLAIKKNEKITLWTMNKGNKKTIDDWLEIKKINKNLKVNYIDMKFADKDYNHRSQFLFILDLIRFHKIIFKKVPKRDFIWKAGQINFFYNFLFLFKKRKMALGPLSGFEYIPVFRLRKFLPFKMILYYVFYNSIIFISRLIYKAFFFLNHRDNFIFFATKKDLNIFKKNFLFRDFNFHIIFEANLEHIINNKFNLKKDQKSSKLVLWSGSMIHRKNPFLAMNILENIDNANTLMIGDGELLIDIKNKAKKNDVAIKSHLPRDQFLEILRKCSILLVTSIREVNSVLILEAAALDIPIVSFHVSGMQYFVNRVGKTIKIDNNAKDNFIDFINRQIVNDKHFNGRNVIKEVIIDEFKVLEKCFLSIES